jgi:Flp pilus assembly protein TadD
MRRRARWSLCLGLFLASIGGLAGCSGNTVTHGPDDQLSFGVQMARQGLWSEALFRFERARSVDPNNPKVLNNVAVALEAAGRYDEALETYRKALELAPGNRDLRDNYARFSDFYESFRPVEEGEGASPSEELP